MIKNILPFSALLVPMLLCNACSVGTYAEEEESQEDAIAALTETNGIQLNGIQLNGIQLNGIQLNGIQLNGIQLNGIQLNGIQLNGIQLNATHLNGIQLNGIQLNGTDFIGATLIGVLSNGSEITLRIDNIEASEDPEILLYTVSYQHDAGWANLCGSNGGTLVRAIPLSGRWDYSQGTPTGGDHVDDLSMFTFACEGFVLEKCTTMGYKPWQMVEECRNNGNCQDFSMRHFHQACTRMMRADYCGDGTPHTHNGAVVNLWDNFDIQQQEAVKHFKDEAEWSEDGALCIEHLRFDPHHTTKQYIQDHCPDREDTETHCFGKKSAFFTKEGFSVPIESRSLIRNEFLPE